MFVIVFGAEVNDGMDETEDEALGSPADYDIYGHVVVVEGNLVAITPLRKGTCISEATANPRETAISDPGERVRYRVDGVKGI